MTRAVRAARLVAVALVLSLVASAASATWSVDSVSGGNGAAAADTLGRGATPTAVAAGSAVSVGWSAGTLTDGSPVDGYAVKRYDAATLVQQSVSASCAGTVTSTSCIESGVPTGQWVYSITPLTGEHWIGIESLLSSVVSTDAANPVNALSITVSSGDAVLTGTTVYYRGAGDGSFTLTNAVSDAGTGPASSTTAALTGTSTGWTHTASTVSSPASGPYVSGPFAWTGASTSTPTEVVTGTDRAGNSTGTTLTFVNDSTAPAAGSIAYADGYQSSGSVTVGFTTGTDGGSGVATRQLQRSSSALTGGTCSSFSSFANVGPDAPTSPYVDAQVSEGACYRYRYVVTDQLTNQHIATSPNTAVVDSWAGGPALGAAAAFSVLGGTGVVSTGTTVVNGDLGVSPSNSVTGFPPGIVTGTTHPGDPTAAQAQSDLTLAYTDAATRTPHTQFAGDLNGRTFHAGIHHTAAALALTGNLTLDAQGDPNATFIFQVDAAMNTAAASTITLTNGAQPNHVYWQVNGATGTGANSTLAGTIMATGAITLGAATTLTGRALSKATITLAGTTVAP
jgi:ice-binding like protein